MLSPIPARTDLTDRECSKIIGGLIGSLCQMADEQAVRRAVRFWAETDELWKAIEFAGKSARELVKAIGGKSVPDNPHKV